MWNTSILWVRAFWFCIFRSCNYLIAFGHSTCFWCPTNVDLHTITIIIITRTRKKMHFYCAMFLFKIFFGFQSECKQLLWIFVGFCRFCNWKKLMSCPIIEFAVNHRQTIVCALVSHEILYFCNAFGQNFFLALSLSVVFDYSAWLLFWFTWNICYVSCSPSAIWHWYH